MARHILFASFTMLKTHLAYTSPKFRFLERTYQGEIKKNSYTFFFFFGGGEGGGEGVLWFVWKWWMKEVISYVIHPCCAVRDNTDRVRRQ